MIDESFVGCGINKENLDTYDNEQVLESIKWVIDLPDCGRDYMHDDVVPKKKLLNAFITGNIFLKCSNFNCNYIY